MAQINQNNQNNPEDEPAPVNGLVILHTSSAPGHIDPREFVAAEWSMQICGARLMTGDFRLWAGGRWRPGMAGDYIVLGTGGEVGIVSGLNFPHLCKVLK